MASPNGRSKTPSTPRIAQLWRQSPQTWKVRPPNKKIPIPKALSHSPLGSLHGWEDGTATTESPVPLSCSMGSLASKLSSMDGLYEMCESRRARPAGPSASQEHFAKKMDCRVKPGNDGGEI